MGMSDEAITEQQKLWEEGHPSTWRIGDYLKTENFEWVLVEIDGLENNVRVKPLDRTALWIGENNWFAPDKFALLRRASQPVSKAKIGVEEGEVCGMDSCHGVLAYSKSENCSCHIGAPCSSCTSAYLRCEKCGRNIDEESTVKESLTTERKTGGLGECQSRSNVPDSVGATPTPSTIEQKPVCHCCTELALGDSQNYTDADYIRHEDVCQFSHLERYMLPIAKAQFRERQKAKLEAERAELHARQHADDLADIERHRLCDLERYQGLYERLTGHKFAN